MIREHLEPMLSTYNNQTVPIIIQTDFKGNCMVWRVYLKDIQTLAWLYAIVVATLLRRQIDILSSDIDASLYAK